MKEESSRVDENRPGRHRTECFCIRERIHSVGFRFRLVPSPFGVQDIVRSLPFPVSLWKRDCAFDDDIGGVTGWSGELGSLMGDVSGQVRKKERRIDGITYTGSLGRVIAALPFKSRDNIAS